MQAEELRIGNWVYDTDEKCYTTVELCDFKEEYFCFYEPIELTEEILLKCGFEYIESKNVYKLHLPNDNQLLIGFNFQNELRLYYKVFNVDLVEINYLHQLQNLYFALTQQELNIEL